MLETRRHAQIRQCTQESHQSVAKLQSTEAAREMVMKISQTVDELLDAEIKRRCWERWNEENKEAIAAFNARISKDGLPLAKYRTFALSLGDGKKG